MTRRLAAVLCADVVGFSRLIGRDEEMTLTRLAEQRRTLIDPAIAAHGGRLFKTMGDGLLIEFRSAVEAVRFGLAMQERVREAESSQAEDARLNWRIAVHLGDVVADGDDLVGDGVNIASRLQALAPPGGVLVSHTIRDQLPDSFALRPAGAPQLKNIARAIEVFEVLPAGADIPDAALRDEVSAVVRAEARSFGVLMGEDVGTIRHGLSQSCDLVRAALEKHGGRTFAAAGNTVLAELPSAAECVERCKAVRNALAAAHRDMPSEARVYYRFGIDLGGIEEGSDGPGGPAIDHAAILSLHASTDGIRLSAAAHSRLPNANGIRSTVSEQDGFELTSSQSAPARAYPPQLEAFELPIPDRPSIALLPFQSMGDDADGAAFAEGLRLDIQNALTKMSGLFLLAAGSANTLRGVPAAEAGVRAGIRHVLEGTVRRSGDRARINVQLVDATQNSVVWSEQYDRILDDSFALQDEITERIVTTLNVKLASGEQARVWHKCLIDPRARETFYRGLQSFLRMNPESMASARAAFERVADIVKDSSIGPTHVALALWFEATRGWAKDPEEARKQAGEWAERAVAMEDADGQAQTVLGNVRLLQRRFDEALAIAHEAVAIRPGCTNANGFLANVLLHCGEYELAVIHAKRAIRFMPVYPPWFVEILAAAYREAGENDFAVITAREVLRIAPSTVNGRLVLASALVRGGWLADARRIAREVMELERSFALSRYAKNQPYRDTGTLARLVEDLRRAGLPE